MTGVDAQEQEPRSPEQEQELEPRPLRRDAERNRQRILAAAREVFTGRGLEVSLDEVAKCAGVGVGTVYRRFADKDELVDALFTDRVEEFAGIAERALAEPDPWDALVAFLHEWIGALAEDVGLRQMFMFASYGSGRFHIARRRFVPLAIALVGRAQAAGAVRPDFAPTDIPFVGIMVCTAAEYAQDLRPDIWRRYLAMFIDGIRASRDGITPLPVSALVPDEMELVLRRHATARANAKG